MTRRPHGSVTAAVLAALDEIGQGTCRAVVEWTELPYWAVSRALERMSQEPAATRRVRIVNYTLSFDSQREYPRPIYARGPGRNATKPKPKTSAQHKRDTIRRAVALLSTVRMGISQRKALKMRAALRRASAQP